MTMGDAPQLPECAKTALRDLLDSLCRERLSPHVEYMQNGNIRCTWTSGEWKASCTITPHWQLVKWVSVKGSAP